MDNSSMKPSIGWCGIVAALTMAGNAKAQWLEPECEPLREFESRFLEDFYGWTTVPIGDIDGDGVIDIAVAAVFDDSGATSAGKV